MSEDTVMQSKARPDQDPDLFPMRFQAPGAAGVIEQLGAGTLRGWAHATDGDAAVSIALFEGDDCLLTVAAQAWRDDIANLHDGNGYCGFEAALPDALCDGRLHDVEFRLAGTGQPLFPRPLRLLPGRQAKPAAASSRALGANPARDRGAFPVKLTIIANFYNMQREAARTLTSLSRRYQQGIGDLAYEVLCVDNGSDPPMQAEWVAAFGPEFRLFTPSKLLPSPCFAINEAASQARGEYLAIMIDGAHLLTPGVFAETMAALAESPASVVAVRHWFVGGDQRWLSAAGYSRELEDRIFTRIHWPENGYRLFAVGAPMEESPTAWLDGLVESNCLVLTAELFDRIGGMDEDFSEPGAGFANLDLFRRALASAEGGVVSLIGEATFHQYHGGTTTNVSDEQKDARVRAYAKTYRELRGGEFKHVDRKQIRFRGSLKIDNAVRTMKGSYLPLGIGVTDKVRPGRVHLHYDGGAQRYLQTTYAECGLHRLATWRGAPVGVAPTDLLNIQEIIRQGQPDCIVTTSPDDGLIRFLDDVLKLFGLAQTKIVRVAPAPPRQAPLPRVRTIVGKHDAPATLADIERETAACDTTLVLYAPGPGNAHPTDLLHAYANFVTPGSYLVFLGTVFGQPWLGYSKNWFLVSIQKFVAAAPFKIETVWDRQLLSTCASGYLHRIDEPGKYDAALDQLDTFENALQ